MRLSEAKQGDTLKIISIEGTGPIKKRLLEMGFSKGEKIDIVKYAPLKDPLEIKIRKFHISLRVSEADRIEVEKDTL
ncbi:MAG: ferrous iron transport protein A [Fibrobacterota bacterium]